MDAVSVLIAASQKTRKGISAQRRMVVTPKNKRDDIIPEKSAILKALQGASFSIDGEFVWGSNYTFLVNIESKTGSFQAVYKPSEGERPLWDFPTASLAHREVAAYLVSDAIGWNFVPPTVYRENGPYGPGSLQLFVDHDPEYHYFNFTEEDRLRLKNVVAFDWIINNADRKGSHILVDEHNQFWLIDHGVCFHTDYKLRTVIWDFADEVIPREIIDEIGQFSNELETGVDLNTSLQEHLSQQEVSALLNQTRHLLETGRFPGQESSRRPYPWPLL